jgi:D-alanyl-lipoteichoic acid acyltransferase DltB (MBOAT superfamily)
MAFNSIQYAVLLAVVFVLNRLLPRRGQNVMLLVASYLFYAAWDWRFLSLLIVSTLVDFLVGGAMPGASEKNRKRLLTTSMVVNLGILGFFKYFDFFAESFANLLNDLGFNASTPTLKIILPVGISFYTFQTMSYTIDIYRRQMEPTRDLLSFAVFVSFFPQLVAGPIERARHLLPQFENDRSKVGRADIGSGLYLILIGLFKKVVLADAVAPVVEGAFSNAATAGWLQLLIGIYAFSLQIYGDFSGYSSIARGSARILGIDLMVNFNQPYLSKNVTQFWRTWHISLSTWLRDYLYIPLGGNRGSQWLTYRNLMVTMLLGGLWHGAAWVFVFWGFLHGLYLSVHRWVRRDGEKGDPVLPGWRDIPFVVVTFHLVALAWIFFRSTSMSDAFSYLDGIFSVREGPIPWDDIALTVPLLVASLVLDIAQRAGRSHEAILYWPAVARGAAYSIILLGLIIFSGQPTVPFLYFQF